MSSSFVRVVIGVALFAVAAFVRASEPATYFAYRSFWPEHETMKRFADAASIMFGWLDCPKGITGKEWHRLHWHFKR